MFEKTIKTIKNYIKLLKTIKDEALLEYVESFKMAMNLLMNPGVSENNKNLVNENLIIVLSELNKKGVKI